MTAFLNGRPLPDSRSIGHPDAADLLTILYQEDVRSVADTAEYVASNYSVFSSTDHVPQAADHECQKEL